MAGPHDRAALQLDARNRSPDELVRGHVAHRGRVHAHLIVPKAALDLEHDAVLRAELERWDHRRQDAGVFRTSGGEAEAAILLVPKRALRNSFGRGGAGRAACPDFNMGDPDKDERDE